ncbi:heavy metal translocating P-type ATPase [Sciscionella marina]|uniref:heavy metal translocating P-type ATPase n=1 Tax=Sciscionella marina TaxID=508770 RepID=UPI0003779058|nr:heavy metal translocating P-type ATPase [Sciscionella marina]
MTDPSATVTETAGAAAQDRVVELAVTGMTCAACAARVERKLNKLDGVQATVNFATEKATVHAPDSASEQDLVTQIERAGYGAAPVEPPKPPEEQDEDSHVRSLWRRLVVALLLGLPVGDLSITLTLVPSLRFTGWQWVLLVMTIPVVTWCAWPFHKKAATGLRHGASSMDTLVSIGIVAASAWSLYTVFAEQGGAASDEGILGLIFAPSGSIYLEVAAGVTMFVLAGRLFEAKAKRNAGGALAALAALGAREVTVLRADGTEDRITAEELRIGDRFLARPGETIAADGTVLDGVTAVDTSPMTGESMPAEVGPGDTVTGGTVVQAGRLVIEASAVGSATKLAKLVRLVERAQEDKAGVQRLADRISAVFVPIVVGLAVLTLLGWLLAGSGATHAVSAAIAVLIIACPCALGLATPTALLVASGRGAQLGVFIKHQQALESARAIDTVVLDKTGTLTEGRMTVVDTATAEGVARAELLRLAAAVEHASEHLAARAIIALADTELEELPAVTDFTARSGLGAQGTVEGRAVLVGSARLLADSGIELDGELAALRGTWEQAGRTSVAVAVDGTVFGLFALADTIKPSAGRAIERLHGLGLRTVLLTGDNTATANAVAGELGIGEVIAEVLPADKAAVIEKLRGAGRSVAMVGDGINDAPALASADLGLAVVTGTDLALEAADLILVRADLDVVPTAITLARATLRTIRGNFTWAFGYNIAAIPIAAAGLLNPLIGAAAMALSSLFVVSNSLRLRRHR